MRSTRAWTSQNAGFISLLTRLRQEFPELVVVFDGLEKERQRMEEISAGVPGLACADALGLDHQVEAAAVEIHAEALAEGVVVLVRGGLGAEDVALAAAEDVGLGLGDALLGADGLVAGDHQVRGRDLQQAGDGIEP
jgi:hypothetical protein